MKFQHLQVGQRFEYQGQVYVKSSLLVANHCESGVAKMIPRSAILTPVDPAPTEKAITDKVMLEADTIRHAITDFEQQCKQALAVSGLDEEQQAALASRFAAIRRQLLERLGLTT